MEQDTLNPVSWPGVFVYNAQGDIIDHRKTETNCLDESSEYYCPTECDGRDYSKKYTPTCPSID